MLWVQWWRLRGVPLHLQMGKKESQCDDANNPTSPPTCYNLGSMMHLSHVSPQGWDVLLRAFLAEFTLDEPVKLVRGGDGGILVLLG